jgi:hypothetical protein
MLDKFSDLYGVQVCEIVALVSMNPAMLSNQGIASADGFPSRPARLDIYPKNTSNVHFQSLMRSQSGSRTSAVNE